MTVAYPLSWPPGWPRTKFRESSRFKTTLPAAIKNLQGELSLLGAKSPVISSNVTLGSERPQDPGIAVYFTYDGDQACIPCDRWQTVAENVQAIAKTIEAMRGIERWGAKHTVKAAFRGFVSLPPPEQSRPWWEVLGTAREADRATVEAAYRNRAKRAHPDAGGSVEAMQELNRARREALEAAR